MILSYTRTVGRQVAQVAALPMLLLLLWWWSTTQKPSLFFPPPTTIGKRLAEWLPAGWSQHILPSLANLSMGYAVGVIAGLSLGVFLAKHRRCYLLVAPMIHFARSLPPPAILPVFIVFFGIAWEMRVLFVAFGAMWPVLLSTFDAIRALPKTLFDVSGVFRFPSWVHSLLVVIPAASPGIFAGMRTALGLSLILVIISEMIASTHGIGFYVIESMRSFRLANMWVGIVSVGLLGILLSMGFTSVQKRCLHWTGGGSQ